MISRRLEEFNSIIAEAGITLAVFGRAVVTRSKRQFQKWHKCKTEFFKTSSYRSMYMELTKFTEAQAPIEGGLWKSVLKLDTFCSIPSCFTGGKSLVNVQLAHPEISQGTFPKQFTVGSTVGVIPMRLTSPPHGNPKRSTSKRFEVRIHRTTRCGATGRPDWGHCFLVFHRNQVETRNPRIFSEHCEAPQTSVENGTPFSNTEVEAPTQR